MAVKLLHSMPGIDDEQFGREFKNLTELNHPNIVQLLGYCDETEEVAVEYNGKLITALKVHRALCLEYMPNGSLEKYLFGAISLLLCVLASMQKLFVYI